MPASGTCKARDVEQTVRTARVTVRAPYRSGYQYSNVKLNAVLAREENPPVGIEPIEWLLLTSMKVDTFEQAITIIEWYTCGFPLKYFSEL